MLFTKPRKTTLGFTVFLITINTILVFEFGQNQYSIWDLYYELVKKSENKLRANPNLVEELQTRRLADIPAVQLQIESVASKSVKHNELPQIVNQYSNLAPEHTGKNIYKWLENGIIHLSDKPRKVSKNTPITIIGLIKPEMISINFISSEADYDVKEKIKYRVLQAKEMTADRA